VGARFKLIALLCALTFCAVGLCAPGAAARKFAPPQPPQPAVAQAEQARALTPQERRGRALYLRGESTAGREIVATVGELEVPATTVNCAGCHGRRAEGKTEGGVTAGNLTWANLTKSYGHTHPTGRKHGPFDEASFINAVARGIDPAQNPLVVAMPRYRMAPEDMADLIAYLKRIEFDRDPGLTPESIEVGVPLPSTGALKEVGASMREVLTAYFDDLNSRGGIYNRRIKLHSTADSTGSATQFLTSVRALAHEGQAFAFIGGLSAGADKELSAFARDEEVPFIGPATLLPQTEQPPNRYVFYLLPGVAEQARALVNFAETTLNLKQARAAIVYQDREVPGAVAAATAEQAQQAGWRAVSKRPFASDSFDAARLAQELKAQATEVVFFYGSGAQQAGFLSAAGALNWTPHVFLLSALLENNLASAVPIAFKQKIFIAFPTVPTDVTAAGAAEYRALLEKYKLNPRHTASQLAALAAAKTFVEGLKRAGADLGREQLVTALEGLYDYETGLTPHLSFGPNRRVGAAGAYIVTINPETKAFVPVGGWVTAN
jgi:ABC-type branched-subunit amino acid transport system substrate-binding protein